MRAYPCFQVFVWMFCRLGINMQKEFTNLKSNIMWLAQCWVPLFSFKTKVPCLIFKKYKISLKFAQQIVGLHFKKTWTYKFTKSRGLRKDRFFLDVVENYVFLSLWKSIGTPPPPLNLQDIYYQSSIHMNSSFFIVLIPFLDAYPVVNSCIKSWNNHGLWISTVPSLKTSGLIVQNLWEGAHDSPHHTPVLNTQKS